MRQPRLTVLVVALIGCAGHDLEPARSPPAPLVTSIEHAVPAAAALLTPAPSEPPPEEPPRDEPITLAAVGDVMLARTIGDRLERESPFVHVASLLRGADLAVANLECTIAEGGAPLKKAFAFRAPPLGVRALADAGIDVVSVANNHALDFGRDAFGETLTLLERASIAHAGGGRSEDEAHRAAVVHVRGHGVAFLGYVKVPVEGLGGFDAASWVAHGDSPGIAWAEPARITADVARAKEEGAEHVVVMLHAGFEMASRPIIWQTQAAEAAIDAGADLVLGAHPHVLQGARRRGKGFIAYSLGNFVFDGRDGYSAILHVTLDGSGVRDVDWTPVFLRDGVPELVDELTGRYVKNLIKGLSLGI